VIARAFLLSILFAGTGCPKGPPRSAADVNTNDLPQTVTDLNHYIDEQFPKQAAAAMENSLVAADKALALEKNYETLWRAARACSWLAQDGRKDYTMRCIEYARAATEMDRARVEGMYYLGITVGQHADMYHSAKQVPEVVASAKLAATSDEKFDHAGPLRLLGYTYARAPAPPTSVGDIDEGLKSLKRACELAPRYPLNHLFYGHALFIDNDLDQSERELRLVVDAAPTVETAHWLPQWQKDAQKYLNAVQRKRHSNASDGNP
jgi:hypothetical protein